MKVEEVIIIGAGPAGLATAIQLTRYGVHPILFERAQAGGLLRNANLVENYPGFPVGISGLDLVNLFMQQAQNLSIDVTYEEVIELSYDQGLFQVKTEQNNYASRLAVIATGTKPLRFTGFVIPEDLTDRIFYEVYDLLQTESKHIVIVGSGDAAFDYAMNLSRKNRITILNRGEQPKCLPLLWERTQKVSAITYRNNTEVYQLTKDSTVGMLLDCRIPAGGIQYHADYLIGAIGREARLDCLSQMILQLARSLEDQGVLYKIGDVKNGIYRQTSIAVGEGVMTAMKICRQLKETSA
jgi:thioredoxin reductase (NADPH)